MAQHDYSLANASGAAFRSDLNDALNAIVTLNSGASAPSTMFARMWWAATTSGLLKQRNAANTGWLVRGTLAETFVIARSSDTILGVGDHARIFIATGTFTQTLTAAATLGDGWYVGYRNDGSGVITIDPNASETIDGGTTITLQPGESCFIFCNGTAFKTSGRRRINDFTEDLAPDSANDFVETWDASATGHKKVKLQNIPQGLLKLASGTVSAAATLDIVMTGYTAYKNKILVLNGFVPATDGAVLRFQVSTDGGSTFDGAASDYGQGGYSSSGGAPGAISAIDSGAIDITDGNSDSTASTGGIQAIVKMFNTNDAAKRPLFLIESVTLNSDASALWTTHSGAHRAAAQDTDAVRVFFHSGNISEGSWALYGMS